MKCPICGYETTENERACTRCASFRQFYGDAVDKAPPPGEFVELEPMDQASRQPPSKFGRYIVAAMVAALAWSLWGIFDYMQDQMIATAITMGVSSHCDAEWQPSLDKIYQNASCPQRWQDKLSSAKPQVKYTSLDHANVTFIRDGKVVDTAEMERVDFTWCYYDKRYDARVTKSNDW